MNIPNSLLASIPGKMSHAAASSQLVKAANAFEANFLGELLKPMREDPLFGNGSGLGGDSLGSDGSSSGSMGTIGSLASDALAQAIARQGGLGIAKMVLSQLAPVEQTASQAATALAGESCGGCAPELTMASDAATSNKAGGVAMIGEGNLSSTAIHQHAKSSTDKPARKGFR
jgi:Rod binding domain-containing protein